MHLVDRLFLCVALKLDAFRIDLPGAQAIDPIRPGEQAEHACRVRPPVAPVVILKPVVDCLKPSFDPLKPALDLKPALNHLTVISH